MRKTRIANFELKQATKDDAQLVQHFINQLAKYEKMEDEVTGTLDDLKRNIWDNNYAQVLLAYYHGKAVGFCLYFTTFSTFTAKGSLYLEDLYIEVEYRKKGLGKEIFYQLACIAKENDYTRFEWVCLNWNEPSIRFYEDVIMAKPQDEWLRYRLDEEGIAKLINKK